MICFFIEVIAIIVIRAILSTILEIPIGKQEEQLSDENLQEKEDLLLKIVKNN